MADAATALRDAARALADIGDTPRLDAELLMAHAADVSRERLLLDLRDMATPDGFAALVERRLAHEPVAYIVGYRDFWTIRLTVAPGVLIPRADSETLLEAAVAAFAGTGGPQLILDLGCGPGTLLLAALDQWPQAHGTGVERSGAARALAQDNAAALDMADRARIVAGDWTQSGWAEALGGGYDLILCNPPYVESDASLAREVADHEPPEALYAGGNGLGDYRAIMPAVPALLGETGVAIFELGAGQADDVAKIATHTGLEAATRRDLGGHERALILQKTAGNNMG